MDTPRPTPDVEDLTAPARLVDLLSHLDEPTVVGFEPTPLHLAVHLRPLIEDDRSGSAGLFGLVAERSWCAVSVHVEGVAREPDTGRPTGERAAASVVVHRDGRGASVLRIAGVEVERCAWPPGGEDHAGAPEGFLLDGLHRMLGRPSPGPPPSTEQVALAVWCSAMTDHVLRSGELSWAEAVALHPGDPGPGTIAPSPETLAEATRQAGEAVDWHRVRRRALSGAGAAPPDLSRDDIAWMDATMFARWTVGSLGDPRATVELLSRCGQHDSAKGLRRVLDELAG